MTEYVLPESDWPTLLEPAQRDVLRDVLGGLRRTPELVGVAAGGSFISGSMDEFSDLDLVVVTDPATWTEAPDRRRALAATFGPLLAAFTGEHVGEPRLLICLYGPPLVHVDLKFVRPDALARRVEDPIVLWDRDGRLREALRGGVVRYPAPDAQWIEDRFWIWVHYVASKIGRGELFDTLDSLGFLRGRVLGPLILEEAGAQPTAVRRIEREAPARAGELEATLARLDTSECLRALRATIALYRSLRERRAHPQLRRSAGAEAEALAFLAAIEVRMR
jgi:predicted nucleotidyltransferase